MKSKLLILLTVVLGVTAPLATPANAIDFSISVGDRPYYYGAGYWNEGYYWVWVPGHRSRRGWIRGHYVRRGDYNRAYSRTHFRHHRVWLER
jgi:hypothetical protein